MVTWNASDASTPARDASRRSMTAASVKDKHTWLSLFAPDARVEDPVGTSPLDPTGKGHHGAEAISAFWDNTIASVERLEFRIDDSFAAGDEVANVGTITSFLPQNQRMDAEGVFVYRVDEEGRIVSLRAFWEVDRAMTTLGPAGD